MVIGMAASVAFAAETVSTTTTTTTSSGTISEYSPGSTFIVKESSGPVTYRYGEKVTYVTRGGKTLTDDQVRTRIKVGAPVSVHYDTVGEDLVNHSVNDVLVHGARPLAFLDYLAGSGLGIETIEAIVSGVARGCLAHGMDLAGGETAEMPSFYADGEYDLAGFAVGVVDRQKIIDGRHIGPGDTVIGLASSGVHSNGLSLARKVLLERTGFHVGSRVPDLDASIGEILLRPTRIYAKQVLTLAREFEIKGVAHITGGGITENLPRILPEGCAAQIDRATWQVPALFRVLRERGGIAQDEMFRAFNMGIGLIVVCSAADADGVRALAGAPQIGTIVAGNRLVSYT